MTHPPLSEGAWPLTGGSDLHSRSSAPKSLAVDFESLRMIRSLRYNPSLAGARQLIAEAQGRLQSMPGYGVRPELEVAFEANPRFRDAMLTVGVSPRNSPEPIVSVVERARIRNPRRGSPGRGEKRRSAFSPARPAMAYVEILAIREQRKPCSSAARGHRAQTRRISSRPPPVRGEASLVGSRHRVPGSDALCQSSRA